MIKGSRDEKWIWASGKIKFNDKIHAFQAFLLYFIEKKKELSEKLTDLKGKNKVFNHMVHKSNK